MASRKTKTILDRPRAPISFDDPTPWPGLSQSDDTWARIYAKTGSAREAAAHAGMPGAPSTIAKQMMARDEVRSAVGVYMKMVAHTFSVQREAIIAQLARIGFSDIADLYDEDTGELLPPHRIPSKARASITSVSTRVGPDGSVTTSYQLAPKVKALELLTRVLGMGDASGKRPIRVKMMANPHTGEEGTEINLIAK
mgnify:CR=1 FL=1